MNDEIRLQRRARLMDNQGYQSMQSFTRYMDRFYLDAVIGLIPGWGDAVALLCVVPFVYFSMCIIKSIPLTLAVLNNALRDVLLGMSPFFIGDVIDIFHRANIGVHRVGSKSSHGRVGARDTGGGFLQRQDL